MGLRWQWLYGDPLETFKQRFGNPVRRLRWQKLHEGPQREVTVDTYNGLLTFDNKADAVTGGELYVRGSFEAELMRRALAVLRAEGHFAQPAKDVVVDVGANIGVTCIALVKHGYFRRALAFEPAPATYQRLVRNVRQNGFEGQIVPFACALSSVAGEMALELSDANSGDHRIRHTAEPGDLQEEKRRTVMVPVGTLDDVLRDQPESMANSIGLVWLDIQGHEGYFLEGARQLFVRHVPLVSEFWPYGIRRSGMSRSRYGEIVSEYFSHFYVLSRGLREKLPIARIDNLFDACRGPHQCCQIALFRQGQT